MSRVRRAWKIALLLAPFVALLAGLFLLTFAFARR